MLHTFQPVDKRLHPALLASLVRSCHCAFVAKLRLSGKRFQDRLGKTLICRLPEKCKGKVGN